MSNFDDENFDEEAVLRAIRAGKDREFAKIYDQYSRMIASVLRKIARCPRGEMDFHINEVFFRVYKGIFSFKGKSKFSTYVYRIALNYSFQLSKKLRKDRNTLTQLEDYDASVNFDHNVEDALFLEKALDQLSEKLRAVVVLFYYDRLQVKEIAEIENVSENAVKNRLFQAREKLKIYHKEAGYEV